MVNIWVLKEKESDNEKRKKKEIREIKEKDLSEAKKKKETIDTYEKAEKNLFELKQMLDKWILDDKTEDLVEDIIDFNVISQEEIDDIFKKIDEIESTKDIDNILPKDLRITKDEYKKALKDKIARKIALNKINNALSIIVRKINPKFGIWLNIMWWFLYTIDKKLVSIQENNIDVKNSLKKVDKNKSWSKKEKLSFFGFIKKFIKDFITEIFTN